MTYKGIIVSSACIFLFLVMIFARTGYSQFDYIDDKYVKDGKKINKSKDPDIQEAIKHFEKGVEFFIEENYDGAMVEFLKSFELHPNWTVRFNIALSCMQINKFVEAHKQLRKYIKEGGEKIPADRKEDVEDLISKVEGKIGFLVIECNEKDAAVILNDFDEYKTPVDAPIPVVAGLHKVVIKKEGMETIKKEVSVATGEIQVVNAPLKAVEVHVQPEGKVKPEPAEKKKMKKPLRWLWAGLGAGLGLGAGAAVTGGMFFKKRNDMRSEVDKCDSIDTRDDCPKAYDAQDQARALAITTDVLIGAAGALALTGIILFIVDKPKPVEKKSPGKKEKGISSFSIVPVGSPAHGSFIGVQSIISFY